MFGCKAFSITNIDTCVSIYRKKVSTIEPDRALSFLLHTCSLKPAADTELSNDRDSQFLLQGVAYCLTGGRDVDPRHVEFKLRAALQCQSSEPLRGM